MEFLDIVNEKDKIVGKASKREIYVKHLTHRIVHVLIFNDKNKMLLQLRSEKKSFLPNRWSTPVGGHVSSGENYEQAALREAEEEIGIKPRISFAYKDTYEDTEEDIKKILVTFRALSNGPFKKNPNEVEKLEFFDLDEIRKMIKTKEKFHPELIFLLRKHFKKF